MAIFKPKIPFAIMAISLTDTHGTIVSYQPSLATTGTYGHTTASTKPISKIIDNTTDTNDPPNYNTHDVDYFPWQDRQPAVIPQDISTDALPSLIDESPIHQQTHRYQ